MNGREIHIFDPSKQTGESNHDHELPIHHGIYPRMLFKGTLVLHRHEMVKSAFTQRRTDSNITLDCLPKEVKTNQTTTRRTETFIKPPSDLNILRERQSNYFY